ncbi:MAG: trypsin-like peptidase domain-containing protein [Verrucomicrobiota bacterium]
MHFLFLLVFGWFLTGNTRAAEPAEEPAVIVVQKLRPAVVNIYTERFVEQAVMDPMDEFYERFFGGGIARGNRIVRTPVRNLGSGLIVSPGGYVVTNHHVVEKATDKIKVSLSDGTALDAKLVRADPDLDLSLIKIDRPEPFPFYDVSKLSPNLLGQTVIAIGNPVGYESSVSRGILSAKDRTLIIDGMTMEGLLQTDAAINPGNSGGPLVDINGNFVGLNTAKMAASKNITIENIGFAVPGERVKAFVEDSIDIVEGKKPAPPEVSLIGILKDRFGLHLQVLTPELSRALGYRQTKGLLISDVDPNSPADAAGVEQGMLLVGIGPKRIATEDDLPRDLTRLKKGEQARLTFVILKKQDRFIIQRAASLLLIAQ